MKKTQYLLLLFAIFLQGCLALNYDNPVCISTGIQKPQLYSPKDSSINQSITPLFIWYSVSNATGYRLQLSPNETFSSYVIDESGIKDTLKQAGGILNDKLYYWRVSASNAQETSEWSDIWNFRTVTAPGVPTLVLPTNGATGQATTLSLSWNSSSGAASYTLQVSTNNTFTSFIYNQSGLTSTSQQVSGLNNSTTYYWRVNATNTQGTSGWSSVWSFTIGKIPGVPTLISQINGAACVAIPTTLSWNASSNATSYTLQVSTNNSFTGFVYNQSGFTNTSQQVSGLSDSTIYYWRVSATNNIGTSSWSSVWSFITGVIMNVSCQGIPTVTYFGKTYNTVQVGTQCWLKENLDVGTIINSSGNQTDNGTIEKSCFNDNVANCNTYGGLYQWNEAMQYSIAAGTKGICPIGWHIPTVVEFQVLAAAVCNDGNALKAIGQGISGGAGTNTSGFSALQAGYRYDNGTFYGLGIISNFWSSTEDNSFYSNYLGLGDYGSGISWWYYYYKGNGVSVRCVKDN